MLWSAERAVVTGSSSGIGKALVEALAARGARVAHCSRRGTGGGIVCDVRDEAQVAAFAERVHRDLGTPTIVVNNAGIGKFAPVAEMSVEMWDAVIDTNLRSMFLVTRAFLPAMLATGRGTIVNIASSAGRNGREGGGAYSASKHGVLGFSKSLMLEVRSRNVRVLAVCPGSVDTEFWLSPGIDAIPADRMLKPEDVAQIVLDTIALPDRAMVSELDIRPTNPG
jgi:3-oxoacyl-[acyl-carrier protein] reductase